jgi:serine/threonine protein kinase
MVMELLEGRSLAELLRVRRKLPASAALAIAVEMLRTLAAVHAKGIVHRDLKPDNVFLVGELAEPRLKLLDFGVSLLMAADERRKRLTQAGDVFGTPQYMAPEQAQGKLEVDPRADLFTVGEILYEMLVGHPVFDGPSPLAVIQAVAWCEFEPPSRFEPGIDPQLEQALLRALQRDPRDRFQTADEFLVPLLEAAGRTPSYRDGVIAGLAGFDSPEGS